MDTNRNKKTILDRLDSIELRMLQEETDYAKQYLADEGVDVEQEQEFAKQFMKKIQFMNQAIYNKNKDQSLLETTLKRVKEAIQENAQKTSDILVKLLQSKTPSVQYRKLDKWTEDEIRDVLADVDLVRFMEELDKE